MSLEVCKFYCGSCGYEVHFGHSDECMVWVKALSAPKTYGKKGQSDEQKRIVYYGFKNSVSRANDYYNGKEHRP